MDSIADNILEYQNSIQKINGRIKELNKLIHESGDSESAELNERRYKLYKMVWEMEQDIRDMKEYQKEAGRNRGGSNQNLCAHSQAG